MALEEQRDPQFWRGVASDPACLPALYGAPVESLDAIVSDPNVTPLATEHGGFLFSRRDELGRVQELHTLYRPQGWGREVHGALLAALERIFADADIVTTYASVGQWRTAPPRSFGFKASSRTFVSNLGEFRFWFLDRDAWMKSPARLRWMGAH